MVQAHLGLDVLFSGPENSSGLWSFLLCGHVSSSFRAIHNSVPKRTPPRRCCAAMLQPAKIPPYSLAFAASAHETDPAACCTRALGRLRPAPTGSSQRCQPAERGGKGTTREIRSAGRGPLVGRIWDLRSLKMTNWRFNLEPGGEWGILRKSKMLESPFTATGESFVNWHPVGRTEFRLVYVVSWWNTPSTLAAFSCSPSCTGAAVQAG